LLRCGLQARRKATHGTIVGPANDEDRDMDADAEWISRHALSLWALLLAIALIGADLAWRRAVKRRATLDPQAQAMLRPTTAVAVVVVTLLLASAVALQLRADGGLAQFDAALASDLRQAMPLPVLQAIAWLTQLGNPRLLAVATGVVAVALAVRRHLQLAAAWVVTLVGTATINSALKAWFQRERPLHDHGFVVEHSYSFPSGHASGSMVFYGMLAYMLLVLTPPRHHRWIVATAVAVISLVGISRILLQVHYFSDVLAGYATGLGWLTLCVGSAEWLRLRAGRRATR
jgi:membrane-associated phospholipid phosphatase